MGGELGPRTLVVYRIAQVCRRWRCLVLGSASHLDLCLVCTYSTHVSDMLARSPPLPLVIGHVEKPRDITGKDKDGIIFALQHRDRVRRIRLQIPVPNLQKLIQVMNKEFPMLEYLFISPLTKQHEALLLPKTFQAPHLRHFILINFAFSIQSSLLTTTAGLVTLSLGFISPSAYFHPGDLLIQLSLMPQLEALRVTSRSPIPHRIVEQLLYTPITTRYTP